jgi:hypothetical protein
MGFLKAPKAPDYTPIYQAQMEMSKEQAAVAREQLAWARETWSADRAFTQDIYGVLRPIMEAEAAFAMSNAETRQRLLDIQADMAQRESEFSQEARERYETTVLPQLGVLRDEAERLRSPEYVEGRVTQAQAGVQEAIDAQARTAEARLASYGVDPGQMRNAAVQNAIALQGGAAQAAAGMGAREQAEATGREALMTSIKAGMADVGLATGAGQLALSAANQGQGELAGAARGANVYGQNMASGMATQGAMGTAMMGSPTQWMSGSAGSLSGARGTLSQGFADTMTSYKQTAANYAGFGQALGKLAGFGLGFMNKGGKIPNDPEDPDGRKDRFAIAVAGGEHVIPTSVTRRLGSEYFDKLIAKYGDDTDAEAAKMRLRTGRAGGSTVKPHSQAGAIPLAMR